MEEVSHAAAVMHVKNVLYINTDLHGSTHTSTDKYGHTRDNTEGQQIKGINQHSDVNTSDVKAADSTNGLGVNKSVKRFSSAFMFGMVHFRHHWIVMKRSTQRARSILSNNSRFLQRLSVSLKLKS